MLGGRGRELGDMGLCRRSSGAVRLGVVIVEKDVEVFVDTVYDGGVVDVGPPVEQEVESFGVGGHPGD